MYNASKKKESSSLHSTELTGFSKPYFTLKSWDFQKKILQNHVVHDFTHFLTPFESKLTIYVMSTWSFTCSMESSFWSFSKQNGVFLYFAQSSKIDSSSTNRSIFLWVSGKRIDQVLLSEKAANFFLSHFELLTFCKKIWRQFLMIFL